MQRWRTIAAVLALGALVLTGCSDSYEGARSELSLVALNGDNDASTQPLHSDLIHFGEDKVPSGDDYVVEDAIGFVVQNDPVNDQLNITAGGPFGKITLNRYTVRYISDESLTTFEGALHLEVLSGRQAAGIFTVVPADMKIREPLLSYLQAGRELTATAEITFYGVEKTSGEEVSVTAGLPVHFANWADE
ncbi:MAG: hypothetical protein GF355_11615 [Candidatus Eisenbacteria bacterium]|nr:hypothetical protein [Candidatus Eisenbacteria bacterium]